MKTKPFLFFLIVPCIAALFFWKSTSAIDPDFFWHIRFGKIEIESGIPKTDPFSYSMPSYRFVNHEWLTDIFLAKVFDGNSFILLASLSTLIVLLTLLIHIHRFDSLWSSIFFFCISIGLLGFVGIRPQIISWFLFSILLAIILNQNLWIRWRYTLPLLFLIWANLHGGFPMGIAMLALYAFNETIQKKGLNYLTLLVFLLSATFTLINPYGFGLWKEIWVSMSDTSLRWTIEEWLPALALPNLILWAYTACSIVLCFRYQRKLPRFLKFSYLIFLLAGLSNARNMPFWLIISIPATITASQAFYADVKKISFGTQRLNQASVFVIFGLAGLFLIQRYIIEQPQKTGPAFYPDQAVRYLKQNPPKGNIFSYYGWGGYLIWMLPEKKVFIDGRMPSWKQQTKSLYESTNAFAEYRSIFSGEQTLTFTSKKYGIDTLLLPAENNGKSSSNSYKRVMKFFGIKLPEKNIYLQAKESGWRIVYKDDIATIYQIKK